MTFCPECGHDHSGARWAYICIGCPCPLTPGKPDESGARPAALEGSCSDSDGVVVAQVRSGDHGATGGEPGEIQAIYGTAGDVLTVGELLGALDGLNPNAPVRLEILGDVIDGDGVTVHEHEVRIIGAEVVE